MVKVRGPKAANGRRFPMLKLLIVVQLVCVCTLVIYIQSTIKSSATLKSESLDNINRNDLTMQSSIKLNETSGNEAIDSINLTVTAPTDTERENETKEGTEDVADSITNGEIIETPIDQGSTVLDGINPKAAAQIDTESENETKEGAEDVTDSIKNGEIIETPIDLGATVIGIATGYPLGIYQSFVGSLRKTGYKGHIILGVSPDIQPREEEYLIARNVTMKKIYKTECSPTVTAPEGCAAPYPNIKIRWARFPLARDWLQECSTCTGPVLITDVRDVFFQYNPFGEGAPVVDSLQVFEENPSQTTQHWLVEWPVRECRGVTFDKPMLCSGSTIGTRDTMLQYLEKMYEEMKTWAEDTKCHFSINGDDQSIHNYLFYSGKLPFAKAIKPRTGIVNTVGVDGSNVFEKGHMLKWTNNGKTRGEARDILFDGANGDNWLGKLNTVTYQLINNEGFYITSDGSKHRLEYNWIAESTLITYELIDKEGYFIDADGSRSRMIHQFDRFGPPLEDYWLWKQPFMQDKL